MSIFIDWEYTTVCVDYANKLCSASKCHAFAGIIIYNYFK